MVPTNASPSVATVPETRTAEILRRWDVPARAARTPTPRDERANIPDDREIVLRKPAPDNRRSGLDRSLARYRCRWEARTWEAPSPVGDQPPLLDARNTRARAPPKTFEEWLRPPAPIPKLGLAGTCRRGTRVSSTVRIANRSGIVSATPAVAPPAPGSGPTAKTIATGACGDTDPPSRGSTEIAYGYSLLVGVSAACQTTGARAAAAQRDAASVRAEHADGQPLRARSLLRVRLLAGPLALLGGCGSCSAPAQTCDLASSTRASAPQYRQLVGDGVGDRIDHPRLELAGVGGFSWPQVAPAQVAQDNAPVAPCSR